MSEPNKIEYTSRDIIGHRLLTELANDVDKVAILASKDDLDVLIAALRPAEPLEPFSSDKARELYSGLVQLRREAFGK